jgi:hypothetical protein
VLSHLTLNFKQDRGSEIKRSQSVYVQDAGPGDDGRWRVASFTAIRPRSGKIRLLKPTGTSALVPVQNVLNRRDEPWEVSASLPEGSASRAAIGTLDAWLTDTTANVEGGTGTTVMLAAAALAERILEQLLVSE